MDLLARREHGIRELTTKLKARNIDPELVEEVIQGLVDDNLVSDHRYCESMINARFHRGQGPIKVRYELVSKGVPDSLVDETMTEMALDWQQVLIDLVKKKIPGRAVRDSRRTRKKGKIPIFERVSAGHDLPCHAKCRF